MKARWLSRRALLLHSLLLIWAPGCLIAGWWQVTVALSGNALSYLYSVEWPAFAVFGIVVWWHTIHDDPETVGQRGLRRARRARLAVAPDSDAIITRSRDDEDEALAAYNDYLAALATADRRKTWRFK